MDKVLDIAEYDIDALALKATILLHLKNKEEVMLCCNKIRIIDPENQVVKENITQIKKKFKNYSSYNIKDFSSSNECKL